MTTQLSDQVIPVKEQRFLLPGYYSWEEFEKIEAVIADTPGLRMTYLDGFVEFMTLGEPHETIKAIISFLLQLYFYELGIEYIPVGSATRRDKTKEVSFEPDESYYIGKKKKHPDLAVEVIITSGSINKLEKYKRLNIPEVWFWQDNQLSLYRLREQEYEQIFQSEFLPELDLDLFVRCVLIPSRLEATTEFLKAIRK